MLNTRETVDELARAGIVLTPDEVATLARLEIFLDAQKDASGQWQIPQESIEAYIQRRKQNKRMKWLTTGSIITVFTLFLAIISSTKDGLDLISEYLPFRWFDVTPTQIPPAEDNEILVIIAPFYGDESLQPEAWIEKELATQIEDLQALNDVRVERYNVAIGEGNYKAEIANLQETLNPSIIIWGWFDEVGTVANFEITNFDEFDYQWLSPSLPMALRSYSNPDSFTIFIAKELPEEVSHLVFFTIGQIFILKNDSGKAQYYFENAVKSLPAHFSRAEKESFVQTITMARVIGLNDFEYGVSVGQCLRERDPDSYIAKNILFSVYPLMAAADYLENNNATYNITAQVVDNEQMLVLSSDTEIPLEAFKSESAFQIFEEEKNTAVCVTPNLYYYSGIQNYLHGHKERGIFDLQLLLTQIEPNTMTSKQANEYIDMWTLEINDNGQVNYLKPTTANDHYLLGLEYARLCDYQAAIMQYTSAIEIDGEFANAYISRGENYNNLGIYELALHDLDIALQIEPENPLGFYYRGIIYTKQNENEEALEDFEHAYDLTNDPDLRTSIDNYLNNLRCNNDSSSETQICQPTPLAVNHQGSAVSCLLDN